MTNEKFLDIIYCFQKHRKEYKHFFKKLCLIYKRKYNYSNYCINILEHKIKRIPMKYVYHKDNCIHIYILATSIWILVDKYIEDVHCTIEEISRLTLLDEKKIIQAEFEIFKNFMDFSKWIKRPRSKSI